MPAVLDLVRRSVRRAASGADAISVEQAIVRALGELPVVMNSFLPGQGTRPCKDR